MKSRAKNEGRWLLRIVVHDYSGHPFQLQLSRALARRGHEVVHQYCSSYVTGQGALQQQRNDPAGFTIEPLAMADQFARYSPVKRITQELRYGALASERITRLRPDAAILCNIPLLAHSVVARRLTKHGVPMVFWHQDIYSHAIAGAAEGRLGAAGAVIGSIAERLERRIARASAAVVPISSAFVPVLEGWGVPPDRISVIPNWGALDELPLRPRENDWAVQQGLAEVPVVLYSGTLGLKHDPQVLLDLADGLAAAGTEARVVVISQGRGREWLEERQGQQPRSNLVLLDFQPYDVLPDVLASADVLLAILERDASRYSVPSKVLTYLCAGRPIVAVLPPDNGAAATIRDSRAGVVVDPLHGAQAVAAVLALLADAPARAAHGTAARRYAEREFDVDRIAAQFEDVLIGAIEKGGPD